MNDSHDHRLGIGGNNPPEISEIMAMEQREKYAEKLAEIQARLNKEHTVPTEIKDDETAGQASDFIKLAKATIKEAENIRLAEKKVYTVKSDAIQAFWKKTLSPLEEAVKRVDALVAPYLQEKEDRKRREAEEKAERERLERERRMREAEEKERIAREAAEKAEREKQEALRKAEEERLEAQREKERIAREAEERAAEIRRQAEEDRKKAEEEKAKHEAEIARLKAEKAQRDAEEKQRIADEKAKQEKDAIDKAAAEEAKRKQDEDHKAALEKARKDKEEAELKAKLAREAQREAERQARDAEREAAQRLKDVDRETKEREKELEQDIKDSDREAREANRDAKHALDRYVRQDKTTIKAEKATMLKSSDYSRTRGDASMATVSEHWIGSVISREDLDLESLRDHIPMEALERAVQSFANAGGRNLKGAIISLEAKTNVR